MQSKNRRCSTCRRKVETQDAIIGSLKAFCSYDCLKTYTRTQNAQNTIRRAKAKEHAERKNLLKTRSEWLTEAQSAFNAYIRLRDQDHGCISCGSTIGEGTVGGLGDAGHFRSRGSAGHLRFHLLNCHLQCKKCNRYLSGNISEYRIGLMQKIGVERLEALECDNSQRSFDVDYLKRIKRIFNKRTRLYKRLRNES